MLPMLKVGALLALAAPYASALTISSITGNFVIGGTITIKWKTDATSPSTFSVELLHASFNQQYAVANNVDASTGSKDIELPVVPIDDGYTIELVAIDNINNVFSISDDFPVGAENTTASKSVHAGQVKTTFTPLSTAPLPSSTTAPPAGSSTTPLAGGSSAQNANSPPPSGSPSPLPSRKCCYSCGCCQLLDWHPCCSRGYGWGCCPLIMCCVQTKQGGRKLSHRPDISHALPACCCYPPPPLTRRCQTDYILSFI
ncbi:hypothetical protein MIND_00820300 [Mycena indigotica]|uniref:Yeast cell wall synthesis Kre9/Knh1-like N-terminal domain-containing protein n=1 Tax=Mycena indigotica TaxID=2126181 RepID=A0A8H6W1Z6_9AGAR|nr:uncharacterized protein MIND_00820300 [Mycena indigotica]KAF7298728.1 hypothetical protein MIND_00820300 [Mycena indigotica]